MVNLTHHIEVPQDSGLPEAIRSVVPRPSPPTTPRHTPLASQGSLCPEPLKRPFKTVGFFKGETPLTYTYAVL